MTGPFPEALPSRNGGAAGPRGGFTRRLAANSVAQIAGTFGASLISLFTFGVITRGLGPATYGEFAAAMAFLAIPTTLADIGLSTTVLREISARPEREVAVMRASVTLRGLTSAAAIAVSLLISLALPVTEGTRTAIALGAIGALLNLLQLSLLPLLQARLLVAWSVAAGVIGRVATLALASGSLALGGGLEGVVWAYVAGSGVTFALTAFAVARLIDIRPTVDVAYWRRLLSGSVLVGAALGVSYLLFRVDVVILAIVRSSEEVGHYAAAVKFIELTQLVVAAISLSLFPSLAHAATADRARFRRLVEKGFEVLIIAAAPLSIILFAFATDLVVLAGGAAYTDAATALRILAFFPLLSFVNALYERALIAAGRERALLLIVLVTLCVNVGLNLVLLRPYGFGAAAATTIATEALLMILMSAVFRRTFGFLPVLRALASAAAASAAMVVTIFALPGPFVAVAPASLSVYGVIVVTLPGAGREIVGGLATGVPVLQRFIARLSIDVRR